MDDKQPQTGWRVKVGLAIFVASIGWPVLIPIFLLLGVSKTVTAAVSGFMLVAAEFMLVAAAAIAGKEGFSLIKKKVFGFLKSHGPPSEVSRTRYTIGLVMFVTPLAFGWASPYFGHYLPALDWRNRRPGSTGCCLAQPADHTSASRVVKLDHHRSR